MHDTSQGPRTADVFALIGFGLVARVVGTAIGVLSALATIALAVRLLGTSSYGVLAFALSTTTIVAGLGRLGLEPGVTRSVAALFAAGDTRGLAQVGKGAFTLVAATGIAGIAVAAALIFSSPLGADESTDLALAGGLGVLLFASNVTAVASSIARGLGRMASMEAVSLVLTLGKLGVVALLAGLGVADLRWVAIGYGVAGLASVAVSGRLAHRLLGARSVFRPAPAQARRMLVLCAPFAVTGLALTVISRFDVLVLGFTGSSTDVGRYEPTLKIVEQVMLLAPLLFTAAYLPAATRLVAEGDSAGFRELYVSVSKLVYIIAAPAIIGFAAFPEAMLRGLYGGSFPVSGGLVWLLLVGFVVNLALGLNGSALAAVGDRKALVRAGVVGTAAMVLLALALVPVLGADGAALATSATYVVLNVVLSIELLRVAHVQPLRRDFLVTVLTSALPALIALSIRRSAGPVGLWEAVGWAIGLWIAWVVCLFGLRAVTPGELKRLMPVPGRG